MWWFLIGILIGTVLGICLMALITEKGRDGR